MLTVKVFWSACFWHIVSVRLGVVGLACLCYVFFLFFMLCFNTLFGD